MPNSTETPPASRPLPQGPRAHLPPHASRSSTSPRPSSSSRSPRRRTRRAARSARSCIARARSTTSSSATRRKLMLPDIGRLRAAEGRFRGAPARAHAPLRRAAHARRPRRSRAPAARSRRGHPARARRRAAVDRTTRTTVARPRDAARDERLPYREVGPAAARPASTSTSASSSRRSRTSSRGASRTRAVDGQGRPRHPRPRRREVASAALRRTPRRACASSRELARTAGVEVVDTVVQLRERIDPKLVLGKGKLDDVVAARDASSTPRRSSSTANLTPVAGRRRSPSRPTSRSSTARSSSSTSSRSAPRASDGKLQVELAQLKYTLPRLGQKDDSLSRLTGGIGGRGPGETKLEIGRRRAKERVTHLEAQLKKLVAPARAAPPRSARARDVPDRRDRRLHERGQEHAAQHAHRRRRARRGQALRDARHALAPPALPRGARGRHHRHRRLHPRPAEGSLRRVPRHVRGGRRRRSAAPRRRRERPRARAAHRDDRGAARPSSSSIDIPRIVVFNKIDLLEPGEARRLLFGHNATRSLVSATDRETTRALLAKIAERLEGRWAQAKMVPSYDAGDEEAEGGAPDATEEADAPPPEDESLTTLAELTAGKRYRRTTLRV